jgi:hypothetical protein
VLLIDEPGRRAAADRVPIGAWSSSNSVRLELTLAYAPERSLTAATP